MFYSIYAEGQQIKKTSNLSDENYVYDIEKEELLEDYVIPYLKQEEFIFNGRTISKDGISVFLIKQSEKSIKEISKEVEERMAQEGKFGFGRKSFIFANEEYTKDITKKIFKEIGEFSKDKKNNNEKLEKSNEVFIVHGKDELLKTKIARFIENLGLKAVILHEQANEGKTIIEKLEASSSRAGYAIILYTPCDKGCYKDENELKSRARQNVVFEHGYFVAKLGRGKVAAIVKGDLEIPSDISGIVYISDGDNWEMKLAMEMKKAGLSIDLNKLCY